MEAPRLSGVLAPVVTPFQADLSPDRQRLIRHCKWLLSQDCGVALFGTNSEANSMSVNERMTLLDSVVAAGVDPARMMPGTGCCSMSETVELTAHAVKHGCAGVLMLPPFYYKNVSEEGLYRYFSEVVQRVRHPRLRIYLYHIPPVAVVGITPKLVERLLRAHATAIAGMKDSSGDWNNTKLFLDAFTETAGAVWRPDPSRTFDIFVGSESFLLANIRNGGVGTISATANVNPAAIHSLFARARDESRSTEYEEKSQKSEIKNQKTGKRKSLEDQQANLNRVREVFGRTSWPSMIAALKQAIAIYRTDPEWSRVRPPLVELTTSQADELAAELEAIGFAMPTDGSKR